MMNANFPKSPEGTGNTGSSAQSSENQSFGGDAPYGCSAPDPTGLASMAPGQPCMAPFQPSMATDFHQPPLEVSPARPSSASSLNSTPVLPPILPESRAAEGPQEEGDNPNTKTQDNKQETPKAAVKKAVGDKFNLQEKELEEVVSGVLNCLRRLSDAEDADYATDKVRDDLTYIKEASRYGERGPKRLAVYAAYLEGKAPEIFRRIWKNNIQGDFLGKANKNLFNNMKDIMIVLWNGTDMSKPLADNLVDIKLYEDILQYLQNEKLDSKSIKNNFKKYLIKGLMGITSNLVQLTDSTYLLRQNDAVAIFSELYKCPDDMVSCKALMVLAYLINEEENEKLNGDDSNFKFFVKILANCMEAEDLHSKRYGFSAHELMEALNRLAANDNNKGRIVKNGILPHYVSFMQPKMAAREQLLAARGIWTLAFGCSEEIKKEPGCLSALRELASSSESPEVRKQAEGALWILSTGWQGEEKAGAPPLPGGSADPPPPPPLPSSSKAPPAPSGPATPALKASPVSNKKSVSSITPTGDGEKHVFISYNWGSKPTVLKVKDRLKEAGYRIWMDVEDMSGSILEAMALAVEKAAVVIICFSQKYKESPNCRTEAEYTFKLGKNIIPLRMQFRYQADGWLGALLGNKLFFDFSKEERFEGSLTGLIRELGSLGRDTEASVPVLPIEQPIAPSKIQDTSASPPTNKPKVQQWKSQEVKKWLEQNGMNDIANRFDDFDGVTLAEYKHVSLQAPEFFFKSLKDDLGLTLIETLRFSSALKGLNTL